MYREMEWYKTLSRMSKGMPSASHAPEVDRPSNPLPSADLDLVTLDDNELSQTYNLISKWKAWADYNGGIYAAAEIGYKQRLDTIRHTVYLEMFSDRKPANARDGEIRVEADERVRDIREKYTVMQQNNKLFDKWAGSYAQLAMTYGGERKDRRERLDKNLD